MSRSDRSKGRSPHEEATAVDLVAVYAARKRAHRPRHKPDPVLTELYRLAILNALERLD